MKGLIGAATLFVLSFTANQLQAQSQAPYGSVGIWGRIHIEPIPADTKFTAIAAGNGISLALTDKGRVFQWGDVALSYGPMNYNDPYASVLTNGIAHIAAEAGGLAIKTNGTVVSWRGVSAPNVLTNVRSVALGYEQGLALRNDGTALQFGTETGLLSFSNITAVSIGEEKMALRENGTVMFKSQYSGSWTQLPDVTNAMSIAPGYVLLSNNIVIDVGADICGFRSGSELPDVYRIFAGYDLGLGLKKDGTVIAQGCDDVLLLKAPTLSNVVSCAVGGIEADGNHGHALALLGDGTIVGWGASRYGQSASPTDLQSVRLGAAGDTAVVLVKTNNEIVTYGYDIYQPPLDLTNVAKISGGAGHFLSLSSNGTCRAWGYGEPYVPPGLTNVVDIAAGDGFDLALLKDGTVVQWGYTNNLRKPKLPRIVAIAAGYDHALALSKDGNVFAWGDDYYGKATVPEDLTDVASIAAGGSYSLALKRDGTVVAWGEPPWQMPVLTNIVAISANGREYGTALTQGGSILQWGYSSDEAAYSEFPTNLTGVLSMNAGYDNIVVLFSDRIPPEIKANPLGKSLPPGSSFTLRALAYGTPPLAYQWKKNGVNIPGATNNFVEFAAFSDDDKGNYTLTVSNVFGATETSPATIQIETETGVKIDPIALDGPGLFWRTSSSHPWFAQTNVTYYGFLAAQSGAVGDNEVSWIETTVVGPGWLYYRFKLSSETNADYLLDKNGYEIGSGETDWKSQFSFINAGPHTIRWSYQKDYALASGHDAAWLDAVYFKPEAGASTPFELSTKLTQDTSLELNVSGETNRGYVIEASTNLVDWESITNLIGTSKVLLHKDVNVDGALFFRAVTP